MELKDPKKIKAAVARSESMEPERRSEIARKAALMRWGDGVLRATHSGALNIGNIVIECAVLDGGMRVLSERAVSKAFGAKRGGSHWLRKRSGGDGADLPVYLSANNLIPFINEDLAVALKKPVKYSSAGTAAHGLPAERLVDVCNVWLMARDAKKLHPSQIHIATQADMLMRGLAKIGIIALVDEATGYQEVRDRHALQAILDKYLRTEFAAWAKRFPDEFYQQMFRLRGWEWKGMRPNRPQCVGQYTKDIVYERLAPGIIQELEKRNPIDSGRRKTKHHQWLTTDVGDPALSQHLHAVVGFMRVADTWDGFKKMLDKAFPKRGDTLQMF